jgi:ribosome-associated toxin RatA of RatAB toxin-antitoxin module
MGLNWADHTVEIEAPIATCFDAIVDYESFPEWQSAVISTEVHSRTKDDIGERVSLYLSTKGQKVDYTLLYRYERPTLIEWDFVEGHGVDDVDGHYAFEDLGDDRTRATYKLGIDPSLPVPGIVARRIHKGALQSSVEELKTEAEKRHAEGYEPKKPKERVPKPEPEREPERELEREPVTAGEPDRPPSGRQESGGGSDLPGEAFGRATSLGKDVAGGAIGLARGAAGTAVGVGREAAGTAVNLGRDVAGHIPGPLGRLLGRDEPDADERDRDRGGR